MLYRYDVKVSLTVCGFLRLCIPSRRFGPQTLTSLCLIPSISTQVDSQELQSGAEKVHFSVRVLQGDSAQFELFCCLYKSQEGRYSAFSPYLQPERQKGAYNILFVASEAL